MITPRSCVLIPSCGRADLLERQLRRMPFLNCSDVAFGIHTDEKQDYARCVGMAPRADWLFYDNPTGSVAVAREYLRRWGMKKGAYDYYVVTDDNASYSEQAWSNLVMAADAYTRKHGASTMAGMHNTAPHFDRRLIETTKQRVGGFDSYANVAMIFQCYPRSLYEAYQYPADAYGLDDRHFYLWAVNRGVQQFRVCMDAPFNKSRYQKGGQGSIEQRARKNGLAIARLATDFPDLVGASGTLRIAWQLILELKRGATVNRLAGGSMRKVERMVTNGSLPLKARKRLR